MLPGRVQSLRTNANLSAVGVPRHHQLHIPTAQKIDWHLHLNDPVTRDYIDGDRFAELLVRGADDADLGDRGFALITGNAVGQLIVATMAFIGLRSATDNSTLRRGRLWVTPLMALAWLYPFVLDDGVVRPGLDVFNGAGVTYCMVTPVIAGLLFLRPDGFARTTGLAVGALGVVFGLLNLTTWWIAHPENWWMGVLHVPLFVVSLALAVTSARRAR